MTRWYYRALVCGGTHPGCRCSDGYATPDLPCEVLVRALVVDDSRAMRLILGRVLRERGCDVVEAEDGRAALSVLTAGEVPDVALVDWNMPVMNGLELVEAVRREPAYRSMRLVMVTTESESSQVIRALEAGADEYLFKPFTPDAVVDKLAMLGLLIGA